MKNLKLPYLTLFVLFIFCSKNKEDSQKVFNGENYSNNINKNEKKMDLDIIKIKKYIELQKNIESDEIESDNPHNLSATDLELSFEIINEGLRNNGYKTPSLEKFNSFVVSKEVQKTWRYSKYFDVDCSAWKTDDIFSHFQLVERNQYIFSSQKYLFITDFYLLNEIIKINSDNTYRINIPQSIIARNKYLFNDSKADLVWLKFNDKIFLESLVKVFGYVKDKDLLKFVLENNYKNPDELGKILSNNNCDGVLKFNKEVIDFIIGAGESDQKRYLDGISDYMVYEVKNKNSKFGSNFSQKAEILGKLGYYCEKLGDKIGMQYKFFSILGNEDGGKKYVEEFKKHNFYNIADFENIWDETKTGGVSYPGME